VILNKGERRWDQLVKRYDDARSALAALGVQPEGAAQVAEQRALRVCMSVSGRPMPTNIEFVQVEDPDLRSLMASIWMDGLGVGVASDPRVAQPESIGLTQLAAAVRGVDELTDGGMQLPQVIARIGLTDPPALMDMALNRAVRYVQLPGSSLRPKPPEKQLFILGAGTWADALSAGRFCLQLIDEGLSISQPPDEELM